MERLIRIEVAGSDDQTLNPIYFITDLEVAVIVNMMADGSWEDLSKHLSYRHGGGIKDRINPDPNFDHYNAGEYDQIPYNDPRDRR